MEEFHLSILSDLPLFFLLSLLHHYSPASLSLSLSLSIYSIFSSLQTISHFFILHYHGPSRFITFTWTLPPHNLFLPLPHILSCFPQYSSPFLSSRLSHSHHMFVPNYLINYLPGSRAFIFSLLIPVSINSSY